MPRAQIIDIYRIECPQTGAGAYKMGCGPYSSGLEPVDRHPGPANDEKLSEALFKAASNGRLRHRPIDLWTLPEVFRHRPTNHTARFGFTSMASLREWFDRPNLYRCAERGLKIAVYRAHRSTVFEGDRQAVFYPQGARVIRMLSPLTTEI